MRNIYFTTTTFLFLLWDILSKRFIENTLHTKIELISEFMYFKKVYNSGIAFSFPIPWLLLKSMTLLLIFGIIGYYFYERREKIYSLYDLWFSLIIAGAVWNAIGRISQWYVLDFIGVRYFSVFNIADIWISLWAITLIYFYWKNKAPTS